MAIRPRGSAFQCSLTIKGRRYRKDFATRAEAEMWEASLLKATASGDVAAPIAALGVAPVTLQELFHRTKERYWVGTNSEAITVRNAEIVVNLLGPSTHFRRIGPEQIDALTMALKSGTKSYSGATVNRKLAALSKMLSYAAKMGWIDKRPHFEWEHEAEGRLRWFTEDEEARIHAWFQFTGETDMADFVKVAVDTGMRVAEARLLVKAEIERVPLVDGGERLQVRLAGNRVKSGKSRTIPCTSRVTEIFLRRMKRGEARLFPDLEKKALEESWNRCRAHMGMSDDEEFVPHTLRHTFASRLVQRGVPLYEVQKLLGHSTMTLTMRYAKLAPATLVDAVAVLDRVMTAPRAQDTTGARVSVTSHVEGSESLALA